MTVKSLARQESGLLGRHLSCPSQSAEILEALLQLGLESSESGEQHMLAAQSLVHARLQAGRWDGGAPSANSGCIVQQLTPTLWSTFNTSDIRSAHLWTERRITVRITWKIHMFNRYVFNFYTEVKEGFQITNTTIIKIIMLVVSSLFFSVHLSVSKSAWQCT